MGQDAGILQHATSGSFESRYRQLSRTQNTRRFPHFCVYVTFSDVLKKPGIVYDQIVAKGGKVTTSKVPDPND